MSIVFPATPNLLIKLKLVVVLVRAILKLCFQAALIFTPVVAAANDKLVVYIECVNPEGPDTNGSGVVVDARGRVLTARHVAPKPGSKCLGVIGNKGLPKSSLRYSRYTRDIDVDVDAVILEFSLEEGERTDFATYCPVEDQDNLVGNDIVTYGFHRNSVDRASPTDGILSTSRTNYYGIVEMTAAIAPGKSGGPVFLKGTDAIIGIVSGAQFDPSGVQIYSSMLASDLIAKAGVMQKSELCETFKEKLPEDAVPKVDAKTAKSVSEWVGAGRAQPKH